MVKKGWVDYSNVKAEQAPDGQSLTGEGFVPPPVSGIEDDVLFSISVEAGTAAVEKHKLKTGHTVFTAHLAPRATKIISVDDARGIVPGMRFLLGVAPQTEIVKVDRLGSVMLCEDTLHCHSQNTPIVLLVDRSVTADIVTTLATGATGSEQDLRMGLSPLPPGFD